MIRDFSESVDFGDKRKWMVSFIASPIRSNRTIICSKKHNLRCKLSLNCSSLTITIICVDKMSGCEVFERRLTHKLKPLAHNQLIFFKSACAYCIMTSLLGTKRSKVIQSEWEKFTLANQKECVSLGQGQYASLALVNSEADVFLFATVHEKLRYILEF